MMAIAEKTVLFSFARCPNPKIDEEIIRAQTDPSFSSVILNIIPLNKISSKIALEIPMANAGSKDETGLNERIVYAFAKHMTSMIIESTRKPIKKTPNALYQK